MVWQDKSDTITFLKEGNHSYAAHHFLENSSINKLDLLLCYIM